MKAVFSLFFFIMGMFSCPAATADFRKLDRVSIAGSEYVRLKEWADEADFKIFWTKKDEDLQLTSRGWKINLTVNSLKCQINGLDIRFSFPILLRNNTAYISWIDAQNALQPVFYPPKNAPGNLIKTICIDPGHGGKDPGKISKRNWEKTYTLKLAEELEKLLEQNGFKVVMTRSTDRFPELSERWNTANRKQADLFISLHYNAAENSTIQGIETYCLTPAWAESSNGGGGKSTFGNYNGNAQNDKNMLFAFEMHRSILKNVTIADRGLKRARFEVLREAKMPAILIEGGYMTNPAESENIYSTAYRKKMASAIFNGILSYKKLVEPNASAAESSEKKK